MVHANLGSRAGQGAREICCYLSTGYGCGPILDPDNASQVRCHAGLYYVCTVIRGVSRGGALGAR